MTLVTTHLKNNIKCVNISVKRRICGVSSVVAAVRAFASQFFAVPSANVTRRASGNTSEGDLTSGFSEWMP